MKYLLIILLVGVVGCKSGVSKLEKKSIVDSSKLFYVLVNNDTVWYNSDTLFVINDSLLDYGEYMQSIDTIVVCDTIPITLILTPKK